MNIRRFAATAATLLILAACGGGGGGSAPAPTPAPPPAPAAPQIRLLAGSITEGSGYVDGTGEAARFNQPAKIAVAADGTVYVGDFINNVIRKVTPAGVTTTFAGQPGNDGPVDGTGAAARFGSISALQIDRAGNLLVGDACRVRRVTPAAVVTTIAGGVGGVAGCQLPTQYASYFVEGVAQGPGGELYITDGKAIYRVAPNGDFVLLAGSYNGGVDKKPIDGVGAAAYFGRINGLVADSAGNLYATDRVAGAVRLISPLGQVSTFAGLIGSGDYADGTGTQARFIAPVGLAIDAADNLYVADGGFSVEYYDTGNNVIRKISPQRVVSTVAGSAGSRGSADGPALSAQFNNPSGVAVAPNGDLFVADTGNNTIRKVSGATVTTLAGHNPTGGATDGSPLQARFSYPQRIAIDSAGNRYIADAANQTIRKISPAGLVSTFAGAPGLRGLVDGAAADARFSTPANLSFDSAGNLYVVDSSNRSIRKITPGGVVSTVFGASVGSPLVDPSAVVVDRSGNVFISDRYEDIIYKGLPGGPLAVFAGANVATRTNYPFPGMRDIGPAVDGVGTAARFNEIADMAIDAAGNLFVADKFSQRIRKVTPAASVTTLTAPDALGFVDALALDSAGNVFVFDSSHDQIVKVTPAGVTSAVAGSQTSNPAAPGPLPGVVGQVRGLAVSATGLVFTSGDAVFTIEP